MKKIFRQVWIFVKPHKSAIVIIVICCCLGMTAAFFQPLVVQNLTDKGMLQLNYHSILIYSFALIGIILGQQVLEIIQSQALVKLKKCVIKNLHTVAFGKMMRLKLSYFTVNNSAEIINQLNTDISCVGILLDKGFIYMFNYAFRIITGLVGLFYINWQMALCIIVCIPLKLILLRVFSVKTERVTTKAILKNKKFHSWMADRVMGIKEIKLFGRYEQEIKYFNEIKTEILEYDRTLDLLSVANNSAEALIEGIMTAIYYLIGGYFVCRGNMSVGSVLAFISYSGNVTGPITMLMNIKMLVAQIRPSFVRLQEFFDLEEEKIDGTYVDKPKEIEIEELGFHYGERCILKKASMKMSIGQRIAVVGENGCGKSTLLHLLLRLYEPESGKILIDGIDSSLIDLKIYRSFFSVVTQTPYLFQESIRKNVDFLGEYTEKEIVDTFDNMGMADLISHFPEGLETMIGVEGANLSGGEKQKIAIVRAVLKNAPILILDEGTTGFDQDSERWLFTKGLDLFRDKLVIFVTHQWKYLGFFDKIYQLENGKVKEIEALNSILFDCNFKRQ